LNYLPVRSAVTAAPIRRPGRRAQAKQLSREKILVSAKTLFAEKGYDGATIREIASAAGFSTGAVFTNFADKSDLFSEVIAVERRVLSEVMRAAAVGETAEERLLAMFEAGYHFALLDLPLLRNAISTSWSSELGAAMRGCLNRCSIVDLVSEVLNAATEREELARGSNVPLIAQMLWDCFLVNLLHAAFEDWNVEDLTARLRDQSRLILAAPLQKSAMWS
jgi:AcrR family transcriptional regulator